MQRTWLVVSIAAVIHVLAGCSGYDRIPCTLDTECSSGHCLDGFCVIVRDTSIGDPDNVEIPDSEQFDVAEVEIIKDVIEPDDGGLPDDAGIEIPDEDDIFDIPDGPDNEISDQGPDIPDLNNTDLNIPSTLGLPCEFQTDCSDGTCVPWAGDLKICTGPCPEEGCPDGMRCVPTGQDGGSYIFECLPFADGLCTPCETSADCPLADAECLAMTGGDAFCSAPCEGGTTCPDGFQCINVAPGIPFQCVPQVGTCTCRNAVLGCGEGDVCDAGLECVTLGPPESHPDHPPVIEVGCNPAKGTCACVSEIYSEKFACSVQAGEDKCTGQMVCTMKSGWSKCPVPLPGPELCDDKDNDCNGETDDPFFVVEWDGAEKGVGQTCGTGACADGTVICETEESAICSSDIFKQVEDLCGNGIDNDCDGKTDEGCYSDDLDGDGDPNEEDCAPYDAARHHPTPVNPVEEPCCPNSVPMEDQITVCDYDCDEQITLCDAGDLDSDGFAGIGAGGNDCNDQDASIHPGAPEKCSDGVDQDCVDGDLSCIGLVDDDSDGYPVAFDCNDDDKNIYPGAPEFCDYVDNDCDGVIDDGNPGDGVEEGGASCGLDIGECKPGNWVCSHYPAAVKMECIGGIGQSTEICDGKDNNCDDATDETFPDKGKPCDGLDLDQCMNGTWLCSPDGTGLVCSPEIVTDITELCGDSKDNDCDNVVDNGCYPGDMDGDGYLPPQDCNDSLAEFHPLAQEPCCDPELKGNAAIEACDRNCDGKVNACSPNDQDLDGYLPQSMGGYDCDDSDPAVHLGAPEKCGDGIDQDCSGQDIPCDQVTDNDDDGYSPPVDCNDSNGDIHPFALELCNDKDDDCDGVVDNGNPEGNDEPCGTSEGECEQGITQCVHYTYSARVECVPESAPSKDYCDGLDNNCNGLTDEFFEDLLKPCDGPDLDQCKNGVFECSGDGNQLVCDSELVENVIETCDALDNDCDGATDEGFKMGDSEVGEPCLSLGECGPGLVECHPVEKIAVCSSGPDGSLSKATPETCDLMDNDCDGKTDDEMLYQSLGIGSVCKGIGACGSGIVECNLESGDATCSSNPDGSNPQDTTEACNGEDDDCNGHTDDAENLGPDDCMDKGVCTDAIIPAVCVLGGWQCDYSLIPDFEDGEELLCDDLDNNCNGETDEAYPVGIMCDGNDSDQCFNGTFTCTADQYGWECVNEDPEEVQELCNELDDDCDLEFDEDFPVGEPCDGTDDDECENGTWTCLGDGSGVECDNEDPMNLQEVCNYEDDDCDGMADEDFPVGEPCDGDDDDLCENGTWTCTGDGVDVECTNESIENVVEACDQEDNDCDGDTDEGFEYMGLAMGDPCEGIGECGSGTVVCSSNLGEATCSTNPDGTNPQDTPEQCDDKDNNCNDLTDEGLEYEGEGLGGPCDALGECGVGTVVCSPAELVATCSTAPNGTDPQNVSETCDAKDNDCNGLTDDIDVPDKSSCTLAGVCEDEQNVQATCTEGNWVCDYTQIPEYENPETTCEGKDNNCDGFTDETFTVGESCDGDDTDSCLNGTWTCTAAGDGVECLNETIMDIVEQCGDNTDNNCDGFTDEENADGCVVYNRDLDQDFYGLAEDTRCLCFAGQVPFYTATNGDDCDDTQTAVNPGQTEFCNDIDDNCDNVTDEGFDTKGDPCDGDDPDACLNGNLACHSNGIDLECVDDENKPEVCNDQDDDCNGITDDPFPLGEICDGADSDQCENGTWTCKADETGVECVNETITDIAEMCNGEDDNCDGVTDGGFDIGEACDGDDSDLCKYGTWTCKANQYEAECINENVENVQEICDNADNDCDGTTDELWPDKGKKCNSNPAEPQACSTGVWLCTADKQDVHCVDDWDCVNSAVCQDSGSENVGDDCLCGGVECNVQIANTCAPGPACLCGTIPACVPPQQCISNTCVTP